jgi:hypothetical protein
MIVIEGIDGSGKTTLSKRLAKDLNIHRFHFKGRPVDEREFKTRCMQSSINFQRPIIQDRTPFVSELMYGLLDGRDPYLSIETARFALSMGIPVMIYCRPGSRFIHAPSENECQDYLNNLRDNWDLILKNYDAFMVQSYALRYDWTAKNEKINYNSILDVCKRRFKQAGF